MMIGVPEARMGGVLLRSGVGGVFGDGVQGNCGGDMVNFLRK